jgi:hypothetical protein
MTIHSSLALQSSVGPWSLYTGCRTPWTSDEAVPRPLPTHRATRTQNKRTHTSMASVGFEPMIPALERAKTVHTLDCAATVIGKWWLYQSNIYVRRCYYSLPCDIIDMANTLYLANWINMLCGFPFLSELYDCITNGCIPPLQLTPLLFLVSAECRIFRLFALDVYSSWARGSNRRIQHFCGESYWKLVTGKSRGSEMYTMEKNY